MPEYHELHNSPEPDRVLRPEGRETQILPWWHATILKAAFVHMDRIVSQ